jgi:hypothetical protein
LHIRPRRGAVKRVHVKWPMEWLHTWTSCLNGNDYMPWLYGLGSGKKFHDTFNELVCCGDDERKWEELLKCLERDYQWPIIMQMENESTAKIFHVF